MKMATIRTAAKALGISESRLRRDIREGKVEHLPVGTRKLVDIDALQGTYPQQGASLREICEATGLTDNAIYSGVREGWLPHWRDGKALQFDEAAVMAAIAERMKAKAAADAE